MPGVSSRAPRHLTPHLSALNSTFHLIGRLSLLVAVVALCGCQTARNGRGNKQASFTKPESSRPAPLGRQHSYNSVSTDRPVIALTYDDGPHPQNTPRLLDILRSHQVKATFYVTGENVRKHPGILRRIVAEGHEVGNHTMTHGKITTMDQAAVRREIADTQNLIVAATGRYPQTFRPPYGAITEGQKAWIKAEFGMPSILWSVDPKDWQRPGTGVVTDRLVQGASRGGILLLHDIHAPSVDATPGALVQLKRQGYSFVTVSQLIALER